ncbi:hypothetical protein [Tenacibaculum sp. IB213877]|uniref:hypothetical protein n=1 Tax=Tenacibaculum sp. IB213877 TaxID=3097351 RepID=UPI002A5A9E38|nr:hypothetical protein [Tenacibaculum sp. IB213877]MDY0779356.1 hypothetical protein [Tenacibaculum sp. IB213877]
MKKYLVLIFGLIQIKVIGQQLHEKIKVKIVEYGIQDDADNCVPIVQLNEYIDFSKEMTMNYTGNCVYGAGCDGTTKTKWDLKDSNNDGFPDVIGFEQEQIFVDDINSGGGGPEFISKSVTRIREFDKALFCNEIIIIDNTCGSNIETYYKIQIEPIITVVQETQNDIGCNDITINTNGVSQGFSSNSYVWQYHLGDSNWVDFPSSYQGNSSLTLNSSFFNNHLGNVFIQISSCSLVSNAVVYNVISCSPNFKGYYNQAKTSCFYKNDGKISLKLDRDLDPTERLVVTLYRVDDRILMGQEVKEDSLEFLDIDNYIYAWPNELPPGKYYFLYQTQNIDLSIIEASNIDDGSSWDKLIKTPDFEILAAQAVDFEVEKLNDETCFEKGDGRIRLNITSGEDRKFSYIIYEVNGSSVSLYRNWTEFTGRSIIIEGLANKKFRIKVKDNQGCFAKK